MKKKAKPPTKQDLRAQIEQQLSQLTVEQKRKLLEEIEALSELYEKIMEETPGLKGSKGRKGSKIQP